jgi:hypothetical protein
MEKNARTSPIQDTTGMMSVTSLPLLIINDESEHPGQSTVAPYLEAITVSRAKKEYGSMPKQVIPWNKVFGTKVEDA